ncbi:molybdopterin synthase sulfur carrier subunit [Anoxybacillus vitaminiphilus]|uniref:Molybdopterin synthase sulfur carrier subunit n=1 Tax=Paranoxybacillus vitaminiphilus TaxID=581036 RepID=A0A327YB33_9BACL|nr:molybdopterin converting factor subunit 1 [Anoxybacillus vitaminiphilus]RAK17015.1 molybdopterin synthase sulfur carrier subunit [Anoxybacillus vitaminiphilus]
MITILFFAHLQEAIGKERIQLNCAPLAVKQLKNHLESEYNIDLQHVMVAVNEEYASESELIHPGDTVAFIPPVSGG